MVQWSSQRQALQQHRGAPIAELDPGKICLASSSRDFVYLVLSHQARGSVREYLRLTSGFSLLALPAWYFRVRWWYRC